MTRSFPPYTSVRPVVENLTRESTELDRGGTEETYAIERKNGKEEQRQRLEQRIEETVFLTARRKLKSRDRKYLRKEIKYAPLRPGVSPR
jgi:hypothetical protein